MEKHSSLERLEDKMGWGRGMPSARGHKVPPLDFVFVADQHDKRCGAYAEPFSFAAFAAETASTLTLS